MPLFQFTGNFAGLGYRMTDTKTDMTFNDIRAIKFPTDTIVLASGFITATNKPGAARWPKTGDGIQRLNIGGLGVDDVIAYAIRGMKITWAASARKRVATLRRDHPTETTFRVPRPGTRGAPTPIVVDATVTNKWIDGTATPDELDALLVKLTDIKSRNVANANG